jgi:hypothetical protein
MKIYVLKQMYFSVKDENTIALKYFDSRTSVVCSVSKSAHFPEDGQVRPKHVAVDCDFCYFKLRRNCEQSCIKDETEYVETHSYIILHFTYPHGTTVIHIIDTMH